jgi:hypothetical protein
MRVGGSGVGEAAVVAVVMGASAVGGLLVSFDAVSLEECQMRSQPAAPTPRAAARSRKGTRVEDLVMEGTFIEV